MKKYTIVIFYIIVILFYSCSVTSNKEKVNEMHQEVNVYTHRHYAADKELFARFEKELNIKVNVINASADELILKMENEGSQSPADVLITVDAGRLQRAKEAGVLQPVNNIELTNRIPKNLRDNENFWFGLSQRSRTIIYNKNKVVKGVLSTYEDLANPKWKGKILVRSSSNAYNQALMSAMYANLGKEEVTKWSKGLVNNFARNPKGNDRDQVKAIAAGQGDIAIVISYYIGLL